MWMVSRESVDDRQVVFRLYIIRHCISDHGMPRDWHS